MRRVYTWISVGLLLVLRSAPAQSIFADDESGVFKKLSPDKVRAILRGMGFEYIDEANGPLDAVHFRLDGYKVTLLDQPSVLDLFSAFAGNGEASRVNAWNQARRSGRAYLDDNSSFVIEAELDLTRGVTRDTVETFIRQFPVTVRAYADFLRNPISVDFDLRTI